MIKVTPSCSSFIRSGKWNRPKIDPKRKNAGPQDDKSRTSFKFNTDRLSPKTYKIIVTKSERMKMTLEIFSPKYKISFLTFGVKEENRKRILW